MKFEYKLNYDFISGTLSFEITKMPESLRGNNDDIIHTICSDAGNNWNIVSFMHPEISSWYNRIYLRGFAKNRDNEISIVKKSYAEAIEIADVLNKFQRFAEIYSEETLMTVAEIEKKLGIKNLKIVKGE